MGEISSEGTRFDLGMHVGAKPTARNSLAVATIWRFGSTMELRGEQRFQLGKVSEWHMIHEVFPVGMLACNCSILGDESTGEAVVVDPGDNIERVQQILAKYNLRAKYIVATHAHIDHVGGIEKLKQATGAAVLMHNADVPLYQDLAEQAEWLGVPAPEIAGVDQLLKEGDQVRWGNLSLEVLHTPGHSPGSISLHIPGDNHRILSGDTLFQGSIGRTDLWGGSMDEILRSIQNRLLIFPDETPVFPGHGLTTTIGEEREGNPFLQEL